MARKPYNAGDPEQVEERSQVVTDIEQRHEAELRWLLELPAFRSFMLRFIYDKEYCAVDEDPMNSNGSWLSYYTGRQSAGRLFKAHVLRANAEAFLLAQQEHLAEVRRDEQSAAG